MFTVSGSSQSQCAAFFAHNTVRISVYYDRLYYELAEETPLYSVPYMPDSYFRVYDSLADASRAS